MASINRITEFHTGKPVLSETIWTVHYDSGRTIDYDETDTLPMTVVRYLTDGRTAATTVCIDDTYTHCIHRRTMYRRET